MTIGVTYGEQDLTFFRKQRVAKYPLLEKSDMSSKMKMALLEKVTWENVILHILFLYQKTKKPYEMLCDLLDRPIFFIKKP